MNKSQERENAELRPVATLPLDKGEAQRPLPSRSRPGRCGGGARWLDPGTTFRYNGVQRKQYV